MLSFRQNNMRPEIWDPVTGIRKNAPIFEVNGEIVTVPIDFEKNGSVFVVFRNPLPETWITSVDNVSLEMKAGSVLSDLSTVVVHDSSGATRQLDLGLVTPALDVAGPWTINFDDGRGAPEQIKTAALHSWTEANDDAIRFYSGIATYRTTMNLPNSPKGQAAILDLGEVADIASVRLNGSDIGVLWQPPFRVAITDHLRQGENTLEIRVANRWVNRLIGNDGKEDGYTYQEGPLLWMDGRLKVLPEWFYDAEARAARDPELSFASWRHWKADDPLVPSGLLGPVRIVYSHIVPLDLKR
jgi:hypothetical protein